MARRVNKRLDSAHEDLIEWAAELTRIITQSGHVLGYPPMDAIGKWIAEGGILLSDQPQTARVPIEEPTPRVKRTQYILDTYVPAKIKEAISYRYGAEGNQIERRCLYLKETGKSLRTYQRFYKIGLEIVANHRTA